MTRILVSAVAFALFISPGDLRAQGRNDQPDVSVRVDVTRQGSDFVYAYTLTNSPSSTQPAKTFLLEVDARATVDLVGSPDGWTFAVHSERPFIEWAATGGFEGDEPGIGPIPLSPFAIVPGSTLSGFRIRSSLADQPIRFFIEGYVEVPVVDDVEDLPLELLADFVDRAILWSFWRISWTAHFQE